MSSSAQKFQRPYSSANEIELIEFRDFLMLLYSSFDMDVKWTFLISMIILFLCAREVNK